MKRISLRRKLNLHSGRTYWLVVIAVTLLLSPFFKAFVLLVPIFCFFYFRLTHGKLILRDGQIVLFWGLPDSGKSMFLAKSIYDNTHIRDPRSLYVNPEYSHTTFEHFEFPRDAWGYFGFRPHSMVVVDEASLNGWDSRDWHHNFNERSLEAWKKIRHFQSCVVLSNQGFGELDTKIRDSLTSTVYYVQNKGKYSRAVRLDKDVTFSEETGLPIEGYKQPTVLQRLLDPSAVLYAKHKIYGQYYSTLNPPELPDITEICNYVRQYDRSGHFSGWVLKK